MGELDSVVASLIQRTRPNWYQYKVEFTFYDEAARTRYFSKPSEEGDWKNEAIRAFDLIEQITNLCRNSNGQWNNMKIVINDDGTYTVEQSVVNALY